MKLKRRVLAVGLVAGALSIAPAAAQGAIVTNGDFETGSLSGWQTSNAGPGAWFVYAGTVSPLSLNPIPAPPQGSRAAIADQTNVSRQLLYQDVVLPSGADQIGLSLLAYYTADAPIASPPTLDPSTDPNEQYRIDVMRPTAPLDSVASGDILATVFRTVTGDPISLAPTSKSADLSALAGTTVRLRFAVTTTEDNLNAGVDAVGIHTLGVGKAKLNKNNGTARLPVTVSDPGTLTLAGKGVKRRSVLASKSVTVGAGGTVKLLVKPKGKTKSKLSDSGKAKVKLTVTYTPTGAAPLSEKSKVKLKKRT